MASCLTTSRRDINYPDISFAVTLIRWPALDSHLVCEVYVLDASLLQEWYDPVLELLPALEE